jgi:hypothetical protein
MDNNSKIPEATVVQTTTTNSTTPVITSSVYHAGTSQVVQQQRDTHKSDGGFGILFIKAGSVRVDGSYIVPKNLTLVVMLSSAHVDLSRATFVHPRTTIYAVSILGSVYVKVPPNVRVESSGLGILGGFRADRSQTTSIQMDVPTVVLKGTAILGSVRGMIDVSVPPLIVVHDN